MSKLMKNAKEVTNLNNLEEAITEELVAVIGDYVNDERGSFTRDLQPPESVIQAMATAASQVLIAFERGHRLGG